MSDHDTRAQGDVNASSAAAGHEVTDADANPLVAIGIALAIIVFVAFIGMVLLYRVFAYYQPMMDAEPHALHETRAVSSGPLLQPDPPREKAALRQLEDDLLTTYDWIDKEQGVVRIPIDRAIDLLARRGLAEKTGSPAAAPQ